MPSICILSISSSTSTPAPIFFLIHACDSPLAPAAPTAFNILLLNPSWISLRLSPPDPPSPFSPSRAAALWGPPLIASCPHGPPTATSATRERIAAIESKPAAPHPPAPSGISGRKFWPDKNAVSAKTQAEAHQSSLIPPHNHAEARHKTTEASYTCALRWRPHLIQRVCAAGIGTDGRGLVPR